MRSFARLPLALVCAAAVACAGSKPPDAVPGNVDAPKAPAIVYDTSAVAEPSGVLGLTRTTNIQKVISIIGDFSDAATEDVRKFVEEFSKDIAKYDVRLDQPVDLVMSLERKGKKIDDIDFQFAFAVSVGSLSKSQKGIPVDDVISSQNGIVRFRVKKDSKKEIEETDTDSDVVVEEEKNDDGEHEKERNKSFLLCETGPAAENAEGAGPKSRETPGRIVCSSDEAALDRLSAYLRRNVPRFRFASDLHFELRGEPFEPLLDEARTGLGELVGLVSTTPGDPFSELASATGIDLIDFVSDTKTFSLDYSLGDSGVVARTGFAFKARSAWLTRFLTSHPERADVAPDSFWRLPKDAMSAHYGRGFEESLLDRPEKLTLAALDQLLLKESLGAPERTTIRDIVTKLWPLFAAPHVNASGFDWNAMEAAWKSTEKLDEESILSSFGSNTGSYWIVGFQHAPAPLLSAISSAVSLYNRPSMRKWMDKEGLKADRGTTSIKLGARPAEFPKETVHVIQTQTFRPPPKPPRPRKGEPPIKPTPPRKPIVYHLLVVPDGDQTWFVAAPDEKVLFARAREMLGAPKPNATLAARTDLDRIRRTRAQAAGFFSVRDWLGGSVVGAVLASELKSKPEIRKALSAPEFATPIPTFWTIQPPGKDAAGGSVEWRTEVPKPIVVTIIKALKEAAKREKKESESP